MLQGKKKFIDGSLTTDSLRFYILTFGLQHFFFLGARVALLVFISICCCGCPCVDGNADELANNNDPWANRIISMNYERYILETMNLEQGHDPAHNRNLDEFRRQEQFMANVQVIRQ